MSASVSAAAEDPPLQELLDVAVSLAHQAGDLIQASFYNRSKAITIKSNVLDIVTETDQQVEQLILSSIRSRYPTHRFIAEESHSTPGHYDFTDDFTWIIDPVDGTNNFAHSLPHVAVSIGLMHHRSVVVGVVHAPILRETFTAIRGHGAFLTPVDASPQRLAVSDVRDMHRAAVITELGYDRSALGIRRQLERLKVLTTVHTLQSLRSYGSCALNMCYVAAGRCEAYYEGVDCHVGPKPWDSAAGSLVLTEAGGLLRDTTGVEFDIASGRIIAANHADIATIIVDVCKQVELQLQSPS